MKVTIGRELLTYAVMRNIWCQGCSTCLDVKTATLVDFHDRGEYVLCPPCRARVRSRLSPATWEAADRISWNAWIEGRTL